MNIMEMDDDDDVIIEGSALHEYLSELGFTDFEVVKRNPKGNESIKADFTEEKCCLTRNSKFQLFTKDIGSCFVEAASARIISSKMISDEDLLILESLSSGVEKLFSDHEGSMDEIERISSSFSTKTLVQRHYLGMFSLWMFVPIILYAIFRTCIVVWLPVGVSLMVASALVLWRYRYWFLLNHKLQLLSSFVTRAQRANSAVRVALKYLNEINILKRGFLRKDLPVDQLFDCYEKYLIERVAHLLDDLEVLLIVFHDHLSSSNVVKFRSLFHDRFHRCFPDQVESQVVTYSELKTRRDETARQLSGFLTELILYLEESEIDQLPHLFPSLKCDYLSDNVELVFKTVNLIKKIYYGERSAFADILDTPVSYEGLKFDISGPVDSLSLHCRMLTHLVLHFKGLKERCTSAIDGNGPALDFISKFCDDIKSELLSCNGCLEEIIERYDVFTKKRLENVDNPNINESKVSQTKTETDCPKYKEISCLDEPVVEDEVFEAVVSQNEIKTNREDDFLDSQIDKKSRKKQKERCRRVLQEIQPILLKRREMWHEREKIALKRMQEHEKSPMSNTDDAEGIENATNIKDNQNMVVTKSNCKENDFYKGSIGNSIISDPNVPLGSDYDSEEERILLYKKVKKELDEDEATRQRLSDESASEDETHPPKKYFSPMSLGNVFCDNRSDKSLNSGKSVPYAQNLCNSSKSSQLSSEDERFDSKKDSTSDQSSEVQRFKSSKYCRNLRQDSSDDEKIIDLDSRNLSDDSDSNDPQISRREHREMDECRTLWGLPPIDTAMTFGGIRNMQSEVFGGFGEKESESEEESSEES